MTDFITIHLNRINQEQLEILQAAVRLAGDNFEILFQKGILSEDYVAAYANFFKELGNELTIAEEWFSNPTTYPPDMAHCLIDFGFLSCGGKLDCYPYNKGGDDQCK